MAPASCHLPALPFIPESSCYRETSAPLLTWARGAPSLSSRATAEVAYSVPFGVLWSVGCCSQQRPVPRASAGWYAPSVSGGVGKRTLASGPGGRRRGSSCGFSRARGAGRGGVQPRELGPNGGGPAVVVDCRPRAALLPWPERGP